MLKARAALLVGATTLALAVPALAQTQTFQPGDVMVGVGQGKVEWLHPDGSWVAELDLRNESFETTGMCFKKNGDLLVTAFSVDQVVEFDTQGNYVGVFGSGYHEPESCTVGPNGHVYIGQGFLPTDGFGTPAVLEYSDSGAFIASHTVPLAAAGDGGTDDISLADDGCTLLYTSSDPVVHAYDICHDTALPDFASVAGVTSHLYEVEPASAHTVMTGSDGAYYELDDDAQMHQWTRNPGTVYYGIDVAADRQSFWTGDLMDGELWRIDLNDQVLLDSFVPVYTYLEGIRVVPAPSDPGLACKCKDVVVHTQDGCQAAASIDDNSVDGSGNPLSCTQTAAGPYAPGAQRVTLSCNDGQGHQCACQGQVTVQDAVPPQITSCPSDINLGCDSNGIATWDVEALDSCPGDVRIECDHASGSKFPNGTTTVSCTAYDAAGNPSAPCTFHVTVTSGGDGKPVTTCERMWSLCQSADKYCDKYQSFCTGDLTVGSKTNPCDALQEKCLVEGRYCDKYAACPGATTCQALADQCNGQALNCDTYSNFCIGGTHPGKCQALATECVDQGKYCDAYHAQCAAPAGPAKCDQLEKFCISSGVGCDAFMATCTNGATPPTCAQLFASCKTTGEGCDKYSLYCSDNASGTDTVLVCRASGSKKHYQLKMVKLHDVQPGDVTAGSGGFDCQCQPQDTSLVESCGDDACALLNLTCQNTGKDCDAYQQYCTSSAPPSGCTTLAPDCLGNGRYCDAYWNACGDSCVPVPPPVCLCKDVTVAATADACSGVTSVNAGSHEVNGGPVTCTQSASGPFAVGTNPVTLTCTGQGGSCNCTGNVIVTGVAPSPKADYGLYEDEEPIASFEKTIKAAGAPVVMPFDLSQCFDNPPLDQCTGKPAVDNPTNARIDRIEWWPNIEAGDEADANQKAKDMAHWTDQYQKFACQPGAMTLTSATSALLPFDELEDPHNTASFFKIYYTVLTGPDSGPGVCVMHWRGRFDDETMIANLPADKQPVPADNCLTCVGTGCSCASQSTVCAATATP